MSLSAEDEAGEGVPGLLCLNLRREHIAGMRDPRGVAALSKTASLLAQARAAGAPVLHIHSPGPARSSSFGALGGFEARADERVFAIASSTLAPDFSVLRAMSACLPYPMQLAGALWSEAGQSLVRGALDGDITILPIMEACFQPGFEPLRAADVLAPLVGRGGPRLDMDMGENVICLETWRT